MFFQSIATRNPKERVKPWLFGYFFPTFEEFYPGILAESAGNGAAGAKGAGTKQGELEWGIFYLIGIFPGLDFQLLTMHERIHPRRIKRLH